MLVPSAQRWVPVVDKLQIYEIPGTFERGREIREEEERKERFERKRRVQRGIS